MLVVRLIFIIICLIVTHSLYAQTKTNSSSLSPQQKFDNYKNCQCNQDKPTSYIKDYAPSYQYYPPIFSLEILPYKLGYGFTLEKQQSSQIQSSLFTDNKLFTRLYFNPQAGVARNEEGNLIASADSITLDEKRGNVLQGNVLIKKDKLAISASTAVINPQDKNIRVKDNVYLDIPSIAIHASKIAIDKKQQHAVINDLETFVLDENINLHAQAITANKHLYTLEQVIFNLCHSYDPVWHIQADKIILDKQDNKGEIFYGWLAFYGQPIIPIPYVQFPLSGRKTGLLNFDIGIKSDLTLSNFNIPYYLNLATNYDATLTADYDANYGLSLDTEFRYLGKYGQTDINYINLLHDRQDGKHFAQWIGNINSILNFNQRWRADIKYTATSDSDYYNILNETLDNPVGILHNTAKLIYSDTHYTGSAHLKHYQLLAATPSSMPYQQLPALFFNYQSQHRPNFLASSYRKNLIYKSKFNLLPDNAVTEPDNSLSVNFNTADTLTQQLNSSLIHFIKPKLGYQDRSQYLSGIRTVVVPKVTAHFNDHNYYINPSIAWKNISFNLPDAKSRNIHAPIFSLDAAKKIHYVYNQTHRLTITPRAYYLYIPYTAQDESLPLFDTWHKSFSYAGLFQDNSFTGNDRLGDANSLSTALEISLEDKYNKILSAKFGVRNYFVAQKVRMPESEVSSEFYERTISPYVASINYYPNHQLKISTKLSVDSHKSIADGQQLTLEYNLAHNNILAATYTYNKRNNRQEFINFSIIKEMNDNFNLIAAYKQDLRDNISLSTILGLEFSNCCWLSRLVAYEVTNAYYATIDSYNIPTLTSSQTSRGVSLEVVLTRLGSLPNINYLDNNAKDVYVNVNQMLNENVVGYKRHANMHIQ